MQNLKDLELRNLKEKAMWILEIAKHPEVLIGGESEEFFERVGECLINLESMIEQKHEYIIAFYVDGCKEYENREAIERIVAQMKSMMELAKL